VKAGRGGGKSVFGGAGRRAHESQAGKGTGLWPVSVERLTYVVVGGARRVNRKAHRAAEMKDPGSRHQTLGKIKLAKAQGQKPGSKERLGKPRATRRPPKKNRKGGGWAVGPAGVVTRIDELDKKGERGKVRRQLWQGLTKEQGGDRQPKPSGKRNLGTKGFKRMWAPLGIQTYSLNSKNNKKKKSAGSPSERRTGA